MQNLLAQMYQQFKEDNNMADEDLKTVTQPTPEEVEEVGIEDIVDDMSSPVGIASSLLLPMRIFITELSKYNADHSYKILGSDTFAGVSNGDAPDTKVIEFVPFDLATVSEDLRGCSCSIVVNVYPDSATFNVSIGYEKGSFLVFTQLVPQQDLRVIKEYMNNIPKIETTEGAETLN